MGVGVEEVVTKFSLARIYKIKCGVRLGQVMQRGLKSGHGNVK